MARSYTFTELVALSGDSTNTNKNLVQKGVIRPDIKGTKGTGDHRTFGFLDVFEACVAAKLNQIPGGMPTFAVSLALDGIRFDTALGDITLTRWAAFLDQETRESASSPFWLCWPVARVLDAEGLSTFINDSRGAILLVRLDTILIELEQKTGDHSTAAERANAWMKRESGAKPSKKGNAE